MSLAPFGFSCQAFVDLDWDKDGRTTGCPILSVASVATSVQSPLSPYPRLQDESSTIIARFGHSITG
jgi:hypothetical protein